MAIDRNQKAKQDFAAAQARRQFLQALASGATGVVDRFGAVMHEGDSLLFIAPATGYVWQIKAIDGVDPRIPVGQVRVTLVCEVQEIIPVGRPLREMIRILTKQAEVTEALGGAPGGATEVPDAPESAAPGAESPAAEPVAPAMDEDDRDD